MIISVGDPKVVYTVVVSWYRVLPSGSAWENGDLVYVIDRDVNVVPIFLRTETYGEASAGNLPYFRSLLHKKLSKHVKIVTDESKKVKRLFYKSIDTHAAIPYVGNGRIIECPKLPSEHLFEKTAVVGKEIFKMRPKCSISADGEESYLLMKVYPTSTVKTKGRERHTSAVEVYEITLRPWNSEKKVIMKGRIELTHEKDNDAEVRRVQLIIDEKDGELKISRDRVVYQGKEYFKIPLE
ncbi:MAG TPA: hypothetical protein ENF41_00665 [Candidatus Bathyarchaeota archaeon]|nr:hypothetical protein [Candidatus Bathyarchaeota archaeon]